MRPTLPLIISLLMTTTLAGEKLPVLKGEFLTGREAVLPDAAKGRVTLLALGFTYDSRFAVESWIKQFRKDYGANKDVTFYEIPMISGMARLGKWFIDSGMRKGTPKEDQENVITVYGGADAWKKLVGFQAPGDAYLILLDKNGVIQWQHHGVLDQTAYEGLRAEMSHFL